MKLMMISDYPTDPSEIGGGVAAAAYNLVSALLKYTDLEITVFGFSREMKGDCPAIQSNGRLKVVHYPMNKSYGLIRGFRLERKIFAEWLRKESPDIIHAQSEGLYASLAVNSGKPCVYTIHGIRLKELEMKRQQIGALRYFLGTRLIKDHHRKARYIVAINEYTRNEISGLHDANIRMIHNAVDEHFFGLYENDRAIPNKLLQVGGVRPRKDIQTALKALAWLRNNNYAATLDVVGPINSAAITEVQACLDEHDLSEIAALHGLVSSEQLDNFYQEADILVMSSIEESSPISIVQGMAAGKPIVSTDVGGIREMIPDGAGGFLVEARDSDALGERVSRLLADRELRSEFARLNRQAALNDWSPKAVAQKTHDMYEEIVNEW